MPTPPQRQALMLSAGLLTGLLFGVLLVWSVTMPTLGAAFGIGRTTLGALASLLYLNVAIGGIGAVMLTKKIGAAWQVLAGAVAASAGLMLGAAADGLAALAVGIVVFGLGSGLALMAVATAAGYRPVLAASAIGGLISAPLLSGLIVNAGWPTAGQTLALIVAGGGGLAAALLAATGRRVIRPTSDAPAPGPLFSPAWFGMFLAALAGLIALGHAAPIVAHFGGSAEDAVFGAEGLAIGFGAGGLIAAAAYRRTAIRTIAALAHGLGALGMLAVLKWPDPAGAMAAVVISGIAFGAAAAAYPARLGALRSLAAFGAAAAIAPLIGGLFFHLTGGDYRVPAELACVALIAAVFNAMRLPRSPGA